MSSEEVVEPRVVEAVGLIVTSEQGPQIAQYVEKAMGDAILQAIAEGVPLSDSEEIKRRMMAAHARARKELGLE